MVATPTSHWNKRLQRAVKPSMRLAPFLVVSVALALPVSSLAAQTQSAGAAGPIAITDVTVIDGTGRAGQPHMTVVVADGRISKVAPNAGLKLPADAQIVEGTGKFLIPGLWDMHVQLGRYEDGKKDLQHLLTYGITGVRDMASPLDDILRLRQARSDGAITGPRMLVGGPENTRLVFAVMLNGTMIDRPGSARVGPEY